MTCPVRTVPRRHTSTVQSPNGMLGVCSYLSCDEEIFVGNNSRLRASVQFAVARGNAHPTASHSKCEMRISTTVSEPDPTLASLRRLSLRRALWTGILRSYSKIHTYTYCLKVFFLASASCDAVDRRFGVRRTIEGFLPSQQSSHTRRIWGSNIAWRAYIRQITCAMMCG